MNQLSETEIAELNYSRQPLGPSSQACCKITNGGSCGSGTLVGKRNGKSLILTNAHVAGTRVGHRVRCTFPHAGNKTVNGRVIMAGYSDRVMMDWAILEADEELDLPHIRLNNETPKGDHYTGGYPRCQGPFYQHLETRRITHNGTVWRWQPISIGGQSGSGVHSYADNLQYGLLTWSWGGDGAGQTTKSIWLQYVSRAAVGYAKPDGLVELADPATELEQGFFAETNITTLPIWDHLEDDEEDDDDVVPPSPEFAKRVLVEAEGLQKQATNLVELARRYSTTPGANDDDDNSSDCDDDGEDGGETGPVFGL